MLGRRSRLKQVVVAAALRLASFGSTEGTGGERGWELGRTADLIRWTGGTSLEATGAGDVIRRDPSGAHALLSHRPRRFPAADQLPDPESGPRTKMWRAACLIAGPGRRCVFPAAVFGILD